VIVEQSTVDLTLGLKPRRRAGRSPERGRGSPRVAAAILLVLVSIAVLLRTERVGRTAEPPSTTARAEAGGGASSPVESHEPGAVEEDPIAPVLLGMIVILLTARLGGHVFESLGQPAVLGELVVGIILGNLSLLGYTGLDFLKVDYGQPMPWLPGDHLHTAGVSIEHMARIGIIMLLFQVGLEANIADFRRVGASALMVAVLGVVAPMALGWGAGAILLRGQSWAVPMFLGATLCATSVGITARVLRDLGRSTARESQIILGAAVIDDVLGLLVLSVVQGIILSLSAPGASGAPSFDFASLAGIFVRALGFLAAALVLGQFVSRSVFKAASYLQGGGMLTVSALAICFSFAWLASKMGLAPIVGAFAAGLVLEKIQYRELAERQGVRELEDLIRPIADLLVPIFFVMMGVQVDLRSFIDPRVLGLASVLLLAAVIGKQACALGVLERGLDRLSVGIGMIPRGEVGLIFAAIGRQLRIGGQRAVDDGTYSALVVMVIATTLITPPLLKYSLERSSRAPGGGTNTPAEVPS
jgi:Kef-type K+ transport system membrane component KefB